MLRAVVLSIVISAVLATNFNGGCGNGGSGAFPCSGGGGVQVCSIGFSLDPLSYICVPIPGFQPGCSTCNDGPGRPPRWPGDCDVDYYWNGEKCISYKTPNKCIQGYVFNYTAFTCDRNGSNGTTYCRGDRYWNGRECISNRFPDNCSKGWVWDKTKKRCRPENMTAADCDSDEYWNGENCIDKSKPDSCVEGWDWDNENSTCVQINDTVNPNATDADCQSSFYWNGIRCMYKNSPKSCAVGWLWDQHNWNCTKMPVGPSGYPICRGGYWNGKQCVGNGLPNQCIWGWSWNASAYNCSPPDPTIPFCKQNRYWNGKQCISTDRPNQCVDGWIWHSFNSTCREDPGNNNDENCNKRSYWTGSYCEQDSNPGRCGKNWTWNQHFKNCTPKEDDSGVCSTCGKSWACPTNYYWNGTGCSDDSPQVCSDGYVIRRQECVIKNYDNECPEDYYYSEGYDLCILITSASCPANYYWNGNRCTRVNGTGPQRCAARYTWIQVARTCIPEYSKYPQCVSPDKYWKNQKCVRCSNGLVWNGVACASVNPQPCLVGVWNGVGCV